MDILEERNSKHAIEGMNADLAVGPMMHRTPVQPIAILQSAEDALNLLLAGVAGHYLFGRPIHTIGEQRGAAETFRPRLREGGMVHIECQMPVTLALLQFVVKDLAYEWVGQPAIDLVANALFGKVRLGFG